MRRKPPDYDAMAQRCALPFAIILCALVLLALAIKEARSDGADPRCRTPLAPHEALTAQLAAEYGEAHIAEALGAGGAITELWANPSSGTWSLVMRLPGGLACLVDAGQVERADPGEPV